MQSIFSAMNPREYKKMQRKKTWKKAWNMRLLYIMIFVGFAYFIIFRYATIYGLLIAFKKYKAKLGIMGSEWVGLDNFRKVFKGKDIWRVFGNTITISFWKLILGFPAPIILAILLNEIRGKRFKKGVSSILYMPHFLSWTVFGGILFNLFSSTTGSIPRFVLNNFGVQMPSLITDPQYARGFLYATNIWKNVGWDTIIYTAAIAGIDQELYEAAIVDGANHWQEIWHVTLPGISVTIATLLVLNVGSIMSAGFDQIFNLHYEMNTAKSSVDILDTYVYELGIKTGKMEYATVIGITKSIINCMLLFTANKAAGKITGDSPL